MALGMGEINNASALISHAQSRADIRFLSAEYSAQNISQLQFASGGGGDMVQAKWTRSSWFLGRLLLDSG
eukprot:COSAG03_NODE_126_length_12149_cov_3.594274_5_plen_70_part_00